MHELYFESNKEAITFCERLYEYNPYFEIDWKTNDNWGNQLSVREGECDSEGERDLVAKALTDVFISNREPLWIQNVIQNSYYYRNKEEIQRISDLTLSLISDEDGELAVHLKHDNPRDTLMHVFKTSINEKVVHFDSIVNFRMRLYKSNLVDVVGLAIDEFKREEEYQTFVHSLRQFIASRGTKYPIIHVLQGEDFLFFKSNGEPFSMTEVKEVIQKEPLYIIGLDENETNLTPLIAMSPARIVIYGDHPSEAKTLAIINIFQEKVSLQPYKDFPFNHLFEV